MTRSGFTAWSWLGARVSEPTWRSRFRACSTQSEAFWSKQAQNSGMGAKTLATPRTARAPSTASAGCSARARSQKPPGALPNSPERRTKTNACRSGSRGGTFTYSRRPAQNTRVAIAISTPGMPNATRGPKCSSTLGMLAEAKKLPRLMDQ